MYKIIFLTDYKNVYGSKHFDFPYRSGFDKTLLGKYLSAWGGSPVFKHFSDIDFTNKDYSNEYILYTSSEDKGYEYKAYIEDVIYGLELMNANVIPGYKYLRANNNKVFMEILRDQLPGNAFHNISAHKFGSWEDFQNWENTLTPPVVLKKSEGASGTGVFFANNNKTLKKKIRKISRTPYLFYELWDLGRSFKHKGYIRDSKYRKKYIIQDFISGLKEDWKVYVFWNRYYVFQRPIQKGRGIKASGGGYDNYYYGENANIPKGLLDFAKTVFTPLQVPHASLDIAYDGANFYLIEFQCLYFGTAGIPYSENYYIRQNEQWVPVFEKLDQEKVYIDSICQFIEAYYK